MQHGDLRACALSALYLLGLEKRDLLQPIAFGLLVAAHCHTGLISRISAARRPPVTNLYSSAIFVGWPRVYFGHHFGTPVPQGLWHAVVQQLRLWLPPCSPSSRHRWRHHGNDARGVGFQFLASNSRGLHHHRLQRHLFGRDHCHWLHLAQAHLGR